MKHELRRAIDNHERAHRWRKKEGKRMIIGLDFDGTLVSHAWPEIGMDIGAFDWVLRAKGEYPDVHYVLWTVRSGDELTSAKAYCAERMLSFWAINENPTQHEWSPSNKAHCHAYIDDAAIGAPLIHPGNHSHMGSSNRPHMDWDAMGPLLIERCKAFYARFK